jgi:hypothetical protein
MELIVMAVVLMFLVLLAFVAPVLAGWAVRRWFFPAVHPRWLAIGLAVGMVGLSSGWRYASGRLMVEPWWIAVLSLVAKIAFIQSLCRYGIWRADVRSSRKAYDLSGVSGGE